MLFGVTGILEFWASLRVTWGFSPCMIEPCWSNPTILYWHWNARFFSTWSFWDIKLPKPPHKSFLKIIGLGHFLQFLGSSERYCLWQLLLITLYMITWAAASGWGCREHFHFQGRPRAGGGFCSGNISNVVFVQIYNVSILSWDHFVLVNCTFIRRLTAS